MDGWIGFDPFRSILFHFVSFLFVVVNPNLHPLSIPLIKKNNQSNTKTKHGLNSFLSPIGDVLAGIWQYMNAPWSGFREIVFDVMLFIGDEWSYIGYGQLSKFAAPPPLLLLPLSSAAVSA